MGVHTSLFEASYC